MKNIFFTFLYGVFSLLKAQSPTFQWAKSTGGPFDETTYGICTDIGGNVYSAGQFSGTADFDPGTGITNLTSMGNTDIFISKLDMNGNYIWALQVGGLFADAVNSMKNDAAGNLYLTGIFSGTVDFDPGAGTYTMATNSSMILNAFILKLDANGNFLWVKQLGNNSGYGPLGVAICLDGTGNIYVSGEFAGTSDFDPGPGVSNLATTASAVFVLKLNALGNFTWARKLEAEQGLSIAVDGSGNVYTGGIFFGSGDFDPGPAVFTLTSYGSNDGFISKLDSLGNFVWANHFGGTSTDVLVGLALDCAGNIYSTGAFSGAFAADPTTSTPTFISFGSSDIFILKLDASANYIWGKQLGGVGTENAYFINSDGAGDVYCTGSYRSSPMDFDPGPASYTLGTVGVNDIFMEKLTSGGNFSWAYGIGSPGSDAGTVIHIDQSFNVYTGGFFSLTGDFDPFAGVTNLISAGGSDNFILKLSQSSSIPAPVITSATSNASLCTGFSIQLSASGTGILNWYASPTSTTSLGTGTNFATPTLTTTTIYYVENLVCGFSSTLVPVLVTVYPLPNLAISTSETVICDGTVCTMTVSGAQSYLWSNMATTSMISVTPTTANPTYTVSGTTNSCAGSTSITFSVVVCTGFESLSNEQRDAFVIYPNPGTGSFNILTSTDLVLKISNETGQIVKAISVKDGKPSLLLNDLDAGIYFVSVFDSAVKPQKIIISH